MTEIDEQTLETYLLGNYSELDRNDLIRLIRYFEDLAEERK